MNSENLDPVKVQLWREAMAQLRHLNDEVWKRFQFFVWLELILLLLAGGSMARHSVAPTFIFLLFGLFVGFAAHFILKRNRIYYLQMLGKKTLLEDELGLSAEKFPGTEIDHALPWRLAPEVAQKIKADFEAWVNDNLRSKGTIARPLFWILEIFIWLNGFSLLVTIWTLLRR